MSLGAGHTLLLKQDGSVWGAGLNTVGQLGIDPASNAMIIHFTQLLASGAKAVAAGLEHSMILKQDGCVLSAGSNTYGQLGDGSTTDSYTFVSVMSGKDVKAVAAGSKHSMLLKHDGSVWVTGFNTHGQLGDGTTIDKKEFFQVMAADAKAVTAGYEHSMVLKQDGGVWVTGENKCGQLGDGTENLKTEFAEVMTGAKAVVAGRYHSVIVKQDFSIWATGSNIFGQLGDGSLLTRNTFQPVLATDARFVAAGDSYSMLLKQDGSIWATGSNSHGQLGDGSTNDRDNFKNVYSGSARALVVVAGVSHSMILTFDGTVLASGLNAYGQFGDGTITSSNTFIKTVNLDNIKMHEGSVVKKKSWFPPGFSITTRPSAAGDEHTILGFECSSHIFLLCCSFSNRECVILSFICPNVRCLH